MLLLSKFYLYKMKCDLQTLTGLDVVCSINNCLIFIKHIMNTCWLSYYVLSIMYTNHDNKKTITYFAIHKDTFDFCNIKYNYIIISLFSYDSLHLECIHINITITNKSKQFRINNRMHIYCITIVYTIIIRTLCYIWRLPSSCYDDSSHVNNES